MLILTREIKSRAARPLESGRVQLRQHSIQIGPEKNWVLEERDQMNLLKTAVITAVMCLTLNAATALHAQERMRTGMWEAR